MKRLCWACLVVVAGCSGPIALDRAINPQHRAELAELSAAAPSDAKTPWIAWKAGQQNITTEDALKADESLSRTKNPFDARKDPDAVSRGAIIFEANCAMCHGLDARGRGPLVLPEHPCKDFHSFGKRFAVTLHGGAPRSWFRKISEGYGPEVEYATGRSSVMPTFQDKLAREQIWLVITYLQSLDVDARPADESNQPTQTGG